MRSSRTWSSAVRPRSIVLLTAPLGLPTGPLAQLYGVPESTTVAALEPAQRTGILTSPGFLAVQSHPDQTSPVLRGKFVRTKLLCDEVSPPPDNVDISAQPVRGRNGPSAVHCAPDGRLLLELPQRDGPARLSARELRRARQLPHHGCRSAHRSLGRVLVHRGHRRAVHRSRRDVAGSRVQ